MVRGTWLEQSGQRWKVGAFFVGMGVSGALFAAMLFWMTASDEMRFLKLPLAATTVGIRAFFWLIASVRCGSCGGRPAWHAVQKLDHAVWLQVLMFAKACPICAAPAQPVR